MYYHGTFATKSGDPVTVHIVTQGDRTQSLEIGTEESGLFFTTDPVTIDSCVNDTFDPLLSNMATIRLLTRGFPADLFTSTCRDAVVNIFKGTRCVFAGFIEPMVYQQGYNSALDTLEISCIDALAALQYSKYRNVGHLGVSYETVRTMSANKTFLEIITELLEEVCESIDITGAGGIDIMYDGSKMLTPESDRYSILGQLEIPELLFLGDTEAGVWKQQDVLTEILRFLNLHIEQAGLEFRVFSWETLTGDKPVEWFGLLSGKRRSDARPETIVSLDNVEDAATTISIGEVFNQVSVTCDRKDLAVLVDSPLDASALTSPYPNRQKYMTEYSSGGDGKTAINAFRAMITGENTDWEKGTITDWYIRVKNHPSWRFPIIAGQGDLVSQFCSDGRNQHELPDSLGGVLMPGAAPIRAMILSVGKAEYPCDHKDTSPVPRIDMSDYLCISVKGNMELDHTKERPNATDLMSNCPCAVYEGALTGGALSPSDDETTNYIVISGNVVLNIHMPFSADYKDLAANPEEIRKDGKFWHTTIYGTVDENGRYYTQKFYKAETPFDTPVWNEDVTRGFQPYTETAETKFQYHEGKDYIDKVHKVNVLRCMLIIGDKCLVEHGFYGTPDNFTWETYRTREQCADAEEYYRQCFFIGFNPKIEDDLLGKEFSLMNNVSHEMGINAEGMAIPIRREDQLTGQVRFMILNPVQIFWRQGLVSNEPFGHDHDTTWGPVQFSGYRLLTETQNILLKNFEIKLYSDNGLFDNLEENDLMYVSDTAERFVNLKDDIIFKISSALTREERQELGVTGSARLSTPIDRTTGVGVLSIYDRNKQEYGKAEQLYVDSYYKEYHLPRVLMMQNFREETAPAGTLGRYRHPAMEGKSFYVQGISRNLMDNSAAVTLKENWND